MTRLLKTYSYHSYTKTTAITTEPCTVRKLIKEKYILSGHIRLCLCMVCFFIISEWNWLLEKGKEIFCFFYRSEARFFLLLDCLSREARRNSLFCYLIRRWGEKRWFQVVFKCISAECTQQNWPVVFYWHSGSIDHVDNLLCHKRISAHTVSRAAVLFSVNTCTCVKSGGCWRA